MDTDMDHAYIEEQQIVDRYVMGKLPAAEAARFEEHYLSCPQCLDRLDLAESMERGFKRAAGQDAARLATTRQLALVAWLSRLGRSRQMGLLLLALLVVAALPAGLVLRQLERKDRELEETRLALDKERERSEATGSARTAEAEKLSRELAASRSETAREREARTRVAEQLAEILRPQANVAILFLNTERDAGPAAEPTFRLRLPRTPGWIVLAPEIDDPNYPSYRAVLRDPRGRELWRGSDLRLEELSLSLHSSLLSPGDHTLTVEGIAPGGKPVPAGRFTFRVLPAA